MRAAAEKPASTPSSARVMLLKLAVVSKATTPGTLAPSLASEAAVSWVVQLVADLGARRRPPWPPPPSSS